MEQMNQGLWILSLMAPPLNVDGCEANIDCMTFGREDYFLSSSAAAAAGGEADQPQVMLHLPRLFPACVCNCLRLISSSAKRRWL